MSDSAAVRLSRFSLAEARRQIKEREMSDKCPRCGGDCGKVLIWSHKWAMWWRQRRCGYTSRPVDAGRYWRCEAELLVEGSDDFSFYTGNEANSRIMQDVAQLIADLRRQLAAAQAENDALRITSETTIGQLRQQAKHLEDRAKELGELLPLCKQILEWDEKEWDDDGAGFDALRPALIELRAAYALATRKEPT